MELCAIEMGDTPCHLCTWRHSHQAVTFWTRTAGICNHLGACDLLATNFNIKWTQSEWYFKPCSKTNTYAVNSGYLPSHICQRGSLDQPLWCLRTGHSPICCEKSCCCCRQLLIKMFPKHIQQQSEFIISNKINKYIKCFPGLTRGQHLTLIILCSFPISVSWRAMKQILQQQTDENESWQLSSGEKWHTSSGTKVTQHILYFSGKKKKVL